MFKNTAAKFIVFAFDATTGLPKTGDAANITAYVAKDYGTVTVLADTTATEIDATNAKGYYLFDAAQAETNADCLHITGKSSTSNIVVVGAPAVIYTRPTTGWLAPTIAGRTLDVSAGGEAGVDWANVGSPTTAVDLSSTTIAITQRVDLNTIKTQTVVCAGGVTVPAATLASTTNITAGTITTVTTVTNQLTAAQIATGIWQDATAGDFTVASSIGKSLYTSGVAPGASGGLFIAGSNAATTVNFTGNLSGSVGSVTASVTVGTNNDKTGYALSGTQTFNNTGTWTGNLSGSVGSVTGLTAANLDVAVSTRMATYTQPTGFLAATFPATIASPTNITAGTLTTVTNLTNLPAITIDWITAAGLSATAVTKIQAGLSTYGGGDTTGTTTLLSRLTAPRATGLDNLDATISSRSTYSGGDTTGTTTLLDRLTSGRATNLDNLDVVVSSRMAAFALPSNFAIMSINGSGQVAIPTSSVVGSVTGAVGSVTAPISIASNFKKNQALSSFEFLMTDSATHSPAPDKIVTVTRSIDGAPFDPGTLSAVTEVGNGIYKVSFAAADMNGNVITLRATASGADDTFERILTQP